MKMTGIAEKVVEKTVKTCNGMSPKVDITIAGNIYSKWGHADGIAEGMEVSFEYETKGIFNNILNDFVNKVQKNKLPIPQSTERVIVAGKPSTEERLETIENLLNKAVEKLVNIEDMVKQ